MPVQHTPQAVPLAQSVHDIPTLFRTRDNTMLYTPRDMTSFVSSELNVSRLDDMVDRGLWLAGRIGNICPLHRQRLLGRRVVITEQLDLHLLWKEAVIFIKPLPGWMLDEGFMNKYVSSDAQLIEAANGFLATYARLINHRSDFRIAKDEHLLPEEMHWEDWQALGEKLATLMNDMASSRKRSSPRFQFGELRLVRVNMIYRFHPSYRLAHFIRGYHYDNRTYQSFLRRNFTWVAVVFAYLTVVLTAMQVGLGTTELRNDGPFNRASYGFTVFAILLPVAALFVGILVSLVLTLYHVRATRQHLRVSVSRPETASKGHV
jgi:hypothetical protein